MGPDEPPPDATVTGAKLTTEVLIGRTISEVITIVGSDASLNDTAEVLIGTITSVAVTIVGSDASLNDTADADTNAIIHLHY